MENTNEILAADEQALIYDERIWGFLGNDIFSSVEEFEFANNLHKMFKKLQKHERTICSRYDDKKQREQAAEKCKKGYEVFNKLYKAYAQEEEFEDETENFIREIKVPYGEVALLVEEFVSTYSRDADETKPYSFREIKKDFNAIDDLDKELTLQEDTTEGYLLSPAGIVKEAEEILAMIKGNEFPRMVMVNNGVRRDARELGLNSDDLDAAAELIKNR